MDSALSDCGIRYRYTPRKSSSKKSVHSDYYEETEVAAATENERDGRRSPSICTSTASGVPPRMAQLETLEAKMASIEVSLLTGPRRRKSGCLGRVSLRPITNNNQLQSSQNNISNEAETNIQNLKEQLVSTANIMTNGTSGSVPLSAEARKNADDKLATLKSDMEAKRLSIKNMKLSLERLDITDNIDTRIQQAELEYQLGREELELLTLQEHTRALQLLIEQDDNAKTKQDSQTIYSCIDGSEIISLHAVQVEYDPKSPQFGAGSRCRQPGLWLEWALDHTGMAKGDRLLEINGKIVLGKSKEDMIRLLNVSPSPAQIVVMRSSTINNYISSNNRSNAQTTIAQVGSLRSELDSLREQAEEARRTKDGLRSDNLRLTHRISYLEEQVAELLERNKHHDSDLQATTQSVVTSTVKTQKNVTNINITSEPSSKIIQPKSEVQVFQKGPDVTAIVANIPGLEIGGKDTIENSTQLPVIRPKSNQSNVSSTQIAIEHSPSKMKESVSPKQTIQQLFDPSTHVHYNHKTGKNSSSRNCLQNSRSSHSLEYGENNSDIYSDKPYSIRHSHSHQAIHKSKNYDYNSETSAALEIIKRNQQQYFNRNKDVKHSSKAQSDDNSDIVKAYKRNHRKTSSIAEYFDKYVNDNRKLKLFNDSISMDGLNNSDVERNSRFSKISHKAFLNDKSNFIKVSGSDLISQDHVSSRIDGKIIENAHKSSRRLSKLHSKRDLKYSDYECEHMSNDDDEKYRKSRMKIVDYTSEPNSIVHSSHGKSLQIFEKPRPAPPKKPLRLSLHRAQSMQSVDPGKPSSDTFYLHDPLQKQNSTSDIPNKDELKFSLLNGGSTDDIFYSNQNENVIQPDSSYSSYYGNHKYTNHEKDGKKNESSLDNSPKGKNVKLSNGELPEFKKVKKRMHNGRLSHTIAEKYCENNDLNGEHSTPVKELHHQQQTPKIPTYKFGSHSYNDITLANENHQTRNHLTSNGSKIDFSVRNSRSDIKKNEMNGYSNYEKDAIKSENVKINSKLDSYKSSYAWMSPLILKKSTK